jgi:hypothetical protein
VLADGVACTGNGASDDDLLLHGKTSSGERQITPAATPRS